MTNTNTPCDTPSWTIETYVLHNEAMRVQSEKFQAERDRRYAEVATERALAMKIKETADLAALELARESQVYKDERNDAMREQTLSQTGAYPTHADLGIVVNKMETSINLVAERMEAALKPLSAFMQNSKGETKGTRLTVQNIYGAIAAASAAAYIVFKATGH